MSSIDQCGPLPATIARYCGIGVQGWRVEWGGGNEPGELVTIAAGHVFGGEWPVPQVWTIVEGTGFLSWAGRRTRVRVQSCTAYRFDAGEQRLLSAETSMRVLISPC